MGLATIIKIGMFTPIGLNAVETASSARAGISRMQESDIMDHHQEPVVAGLVPENCLTPLDPGLGENQALTCLHQRILQLGGSALQEVLSGIKNTTKIPLFVAVPKFTNKVTRQLPDSFLDDLATQAGVALDASQGALFRGGRAGFFLALRDAIASLERPGSPGLAVVGGVDSYLDPYLLSYLQQVEKRILDSETNDGFRPGEGAAFLLVGTPQAAATKTEQPLASMVAVGVGEEEGHLYSDKPYLGEGLSQAFDDLFALVPPDTGKIHTVFAGFNGEFFFSKEWGTSFIRHAERFGDNPRIEHPAEYFGDAGAALPAIMIGCVAMGLQEGHLEGPALVWAASDEAERGAVCLTAIVRGA